MSDTNPTTATPLDTPLTIERNGVKKVLQVFTGKRGAWDGKKYQAIQITEGTFADDVSYIGQSNLINAMNVILRRYGQDFVIDATGAEGTPEAGVFSLDKFIDCWANLRLTALKLSELNEQYQLAVSEYKDFTSTELIAAFESGDTTRIASAKAKMTQLSTTINALKKDFDERKAKRSKEAEAETTQPE